MPGLVGTLWGHYMYASVAYATQVPSPSHMHGPGRVSDTTGQILSVFKSNRLHVVIFRFFFIDPGGMFYRFF